MDDKQTKVIILSVLGSSALIYAIVHKDTLLTKVKNLFASKATAVKPVVKIPPVTNVKGISSSEAGAFNVTDITSTSFNITDNIPGVGYRVSLDGGKTFPYTEQGQDLLISELSPNTTYQVVKVVIGDQSTNYTPTAVKTLA